MRSPTTLTVAKPLPRPFAFQTSRGPADGHCFNRPVSEQIPSRLGPRHCVQSSALATAGAQRDRIGNDIPILNKPFLLPRQASANDEFLRDCINVRAYCRRRVKLQGTKIEVSEALGRNPQSKKT